MSSGQWKQPQSFYIKNGVQEIEQEIQELKKELEHITRIKQQMVYMK